MKRQLISILGLIFFLHPAFAEGGYCGTPNPSMKICVILNDLAGQYFIHWQLPDHSDHSLPVSSRVVSPIDDSITYSGYMNSSYPYESYSLVIQPNSERDSEIPAVFSYARTFEQTIVYTFTVKAVNEAPR